MFDQQGCWFDVFIIELALQIGDNLVG